jgi:hypothetical protein
MPVPSDLSCLRSDGRRLAFAATATRRRNRRPAADGKTQTVLASSDRSAPRLLLSAALVFAAALAIRIAYALTRPIPTTADTGYYLMVAENLYHGRGFVSDYAWNYLAGIPKALPAPSNEYWMPGSSVLFAGAFALVGHVSVRAAQMLSIIFGAALCAVIAWTGGTLFRRRDVALLAGLLAAANYHLVNLSLYPDHFMIAAVFVNLSLLALWYAWSRSPLFALPAGALCGLAYLVRTDGGLVGVVALVLAGARLRTGDRGAAARLALGFAGAFVAVATPWWVRQVIVFGHPGGANALRTAFLIDYNDLFRLDQSQLTLGSYLQESPVLTWGLKGYALYRSLRLLVRTVLVIGLLALGGLALRDVRRVAMPFTLYLALGIVVPALLVPLPSIKGGLWHMMPGLVPTVFVLGSAAAVRLFDVARAPKARITPAAAWVTIGLCAACSGYWWVGQGDPEHWTRPPYPPVASQAVRDLGHAPAAVLSDDVWDLYEVAHVPCAQFPMDGASAALRVADAIGATYFVASPNALQRIPASKEVVDHPRFRLAASYPTDTAPLLVFEILPPR